MGRLIRLVVPHYGERFLRFAGWAMGLLPPVWLCRGVRRRNVYIIRADGSRLRLCVCTDGRGPREGAAPLPGLLWLHGGGYAMGVPEQDAAYIQQFVQLGCVVIAPDYRRSPDAPYPAALEDAYAALCWMKQQARALGIRTEQLFVGGDSAGGGLAAALSLYARDRGEVAIAFLMPLYPMLDDRMNTPSMQGNDAPVWNERSNRAAWRLYLGNACGTDGVPPYAAPARCEDYRDLPPVCTFVGSIDPFHDETVAFVSGLRAAGIPVTFQVFKGCFHAFDLFNTPVSLRARAFLSAAFRDAIAHCFAPQLDDQGMD